MNIRNPPGKVLREELLLYGKMSSHALVVVDAFRLGCAALLAGQRQHDHGGDEWHHVVYGAGQVQMLKEGENGIQVT